MSKFTKQHYEDVARILLEVHVDHGQGKYAWDKGQGGIAAVKQLVADFADLFAADNPQRCTHCGKAQPDSDACPDGSGILPHHLIGFDREQFLVACGLEPARPYSTSTFRPVGEPGTGKTTGG